MDEGGTSQGTLTLMDTMRQHRGEDHPNPAWKHFFWLFQGQKSFLSWVSFFSFNSGQGKEKGRWRGGKRTPLGTFPFFGTFNEGILSKGNGTQLGWHSFPLEIDSPNKKNWKGTLVSTNGREWLEKRLFFFRFLKQERYLERHHFNYQRHTNFAWRFHVFRCCCTEFFTHLEAVEFSFLLNFWFSSTACIGMPTCSGSSDRHVIVLCHVL